MWVQSQLQKRFFSLGYKNPREKLGACEFETVRCHCSWIEISLSGSVLPGAMMGLNKHSLGKNSCSKIRVFSFFLDVPFISFCFDVLTVTSELRPFSPDPWLLADSHLSDIRLANSYLAESHLADSHSVDSQLANSVSGRSKRELCNDLEQWNNDLDKMASRDSVVCMSA